jgi:hypothetical protein
MIDDKRENHWKVQPLRRLRMVGTTPQYNEMARSLAVGLVGLLLLGLGACAGQQPTPSAPTVTPDQVRTHADKAFDKLKQEEQQRAVNPATP